MLITSRTNPKITAASSLVNKKYRDESGLYLIEGRKLCSEAVKRKAEIVEVFVAEDKFQSFADILSTVNCDIYTVTDSVFSKLSQDKSPDGIICTAKKKAENNNLKITKPFIVCDMQDAGNLGTCIRTALALGISPLILAGECADIFNPKTVRASMGALFSQSIIRFQTHKEAIEYCRNYNFKVYAAALSDKAIPLGEIPDGNNVFVTGNEGHGLPDCTVGLCDGCAVIPMLGDSESLNASICASILMWESTKDLR